MNVDRFFQENLQLALQKEKRLMKLKYNREIGIAEESILNRTETGVHPEEKRDAGRVKKSWKDVEEQIEAGDRNDDVTREP